MDGGKQVSVASTAMSGYRGFAGMQAAEDY